MNEKKRDLSFRQMLFWSHSDQGKRMIQGQGWEKTRDEGLCLLAILEAGFNPPPPEAELSPELSRDRRVITTRWINTGVVKVKWCYVARCYWTRPVKIHDTDTFSRSSSSPRCRLRPRPRRGSSVEAFLSTVSRAGCSSFPLSLTQSSRLSDTRRALSDVLVNLRRQNRVVATIAPHFLA